MAVHAPEPMTESRKTDETDRRGQQGLPLIEAPLPGGPVYWTTFPAAAIQADWTDPDDAHKAVMSLFGQRLPGAANERRAGTGILFRLDATPAGPQVLIQSQIPPQLLPSEARTMTVTDRGWTCQTGQQVAFRVAVNPVTRRSVTPDGGKRRIIEKTVAPADFETWLGARLDGVLSDVQVIAHFRDVSRFANAKSGRGQRPGGRSLTVDTVDCIAVVTDAEALDALRRDGLGRAKAYGCGLLTAQPLG